MTISKTKPKEKPNNIVKKPLIKKAKKTGNTKSKEVFIAKPITVKPVVLPLTPKQEEKLNKSFDSIDGYLKSIAYSASFASLYLLYLVFKSKGNVLMVLNFLIIVIVSFGLIYSSRLFSRQSQKSIMVYSATMIFVVLSSLFSRWVSGSSLFVPAYIIGYFISALILVEMLRFKKYSLLF